MSSLVYLKSKNGTVYVYENYSYWDKNEKKPKSRRKCIGHLDPLTKEILPNGQQGGDHSKEQDRPKKEGPKYSSRSCGVTTLLEKVTDDIGLRNILKKSFPDDWAAILTCAYFLVSEGQALSRAETWTKQTVTPYGEQISSQRISELLKRITSDRTQEFFSSWIKHNQSNEYYCMDITSVSSYSELNEFVSYGYNRDGEDLPQINLLMISGHTSHLPLYFMVLPGSIHDVSTLEESLGRLGIIDAKLLHLVFDRGFFSKKNIDTLYKKHAKFLVSVPFTTSLSLEAVECHRNDTDNADEYRNILGDKYHVSTELVDWNGHRCYLHTYYKPSREIDDWYKLLNKLEIEYNELCSSKENERHQKDYERFFIVTQTPKRGRKVKYNNEAIKEYKKNTCGWVVLISNDIKDPVEAMEVYKMKDTIEKHFDDLKNDLDMDRLRIHSSEAMNGRLFIQFVALILSSYIKTTMKKENWFAKTDMQTVIDEMKSLHVITAEGKRKKLYTTATAFQKDVINLFKLNIG